MLDLELGAWMEEAMLEQARGGPNANRAPELRVVPRASNLAQDCEMLDYLYLIGAKQVDPDTTSAAAAQAGQALESDVLDHLEFALSKRYGRKIVGRRQVPVDTDWFTATADWWEPDLKIVADSKTTSPNSWDIKRKQGKTGHERQLNTYAGVLGAELIAVPLRANGKAKKDGPGVYIVDLYPPDPAIFEAVKAHALRVIEAAKTKTPPPILLPKSHWLCRDYCNYRSVCPNGGAYVAR